MGNILDEIRKPNDIKKIDPKDYSLLAAQIRSFLVKSISKTGGHLASNLGAVELTMALHLSMDFPKDKLIWDVGHQSYTHKILTGRKEAFTGLRTYGGISGFPKHKESNCDAFDTGHSSTSISAALGYAKGRELLNQQYTVAAVIGDGSMTGGMAYEALNNAAALNSNLMIILNDNKMSISENVGGMSGYLNSIRIKESYVNFKGDVEAVLRKIPKIGTSVVKGVKKSKDSLRQLLLPGGLFEDLGLEYIGPVDGHDIGQLMAAIQVARRHQKAVMIHVITKKGKGYHPAEEDPSAFHGVDKFNIKTGRPIASNQEYSYTKVFSTVFNQLAADHEKIVAVCAAMPYGTGLHKYSKRFPERFFDVGIAEEHAVTFAAGLAASGLKPYVAIYSSFLQRAYDQIIHDVCLQDLPIVFCIDRAGIVGADGETHQGIFDISFLSSIPNMYIFAPKNKYELFDILHFSVNFDHPLAIRYPRGTAYGGLAKFREPIKTGKSEVIYNEKDMVILAVGSMVQTGEEVYHELKKRGYSVTLVNARFIKPIDKDCIDRLTENHQLFVTLEENMLAGGFGEQVSYYILDSSYQGISVLNLGINDVYVEHGNPLQLKKDLGLDTQSIVTKMIDRWEHR